MKNITLNILYSRVLLLIALLLQINFAIASDSYRYLHVSIDTPWAIFIFLLVIVLFPFVLSAILYWHFTIKKHKEGNEKQVNENSPVEENNK